MVATVQRRHVIRSGRKGRDVWAEGYIGPQTGQRIFDLHPDGERFAIPPDARLVRPATRIELVFIFNFFDELRRIAPAR